MTPLAWSAITDFVLSAEAFFLSGLLFAQSPRAMSARWYMSLVLLFLGLAPFFAAVDHGFIEGRGFLPDTNIVSRISWLCAGLTAAAVLAAIMRQYFPRQRWLLILAAIQFIVFAIAIFTGDQYILVTADAAPEMILGLVVGLLYARRPGSLALALGIALYIAGSVVQALGLDLSETLNHNALYHLFLIVGTLGLYRAGRKFEAA